MQLTHGYAGSKALVAAVELGLLTTLANGPLTGAGLGPGWGCSRGALSTGSMRWSRSACSNAMVTCTRTRRHRPVPGPRHIDGLDREAM